MTTNRHLILVSLLFPSLAVTYSTSITAQPLPPPPVLFDNTPTPPSSLPTLDSPLPPPFPSPNAPVNPREYNFQAPLSPTRIPPRNSRLYRVDVNGDNNSLLSQVQRIAPDAYIRSGEGVIQAGVFSERDNAEARVRELRAQGIRAQVTTFNSGSGGGRPQRPQTGDRSNGYFVIIPGSEDDLPGIARRVVRLGIRRSVVTPRDSRLGSHVAVGPFAERGEAERWNSYIRSEGMDSRVYYDR